MKLNLKNLFTLAFTVAFTVSSLVPSARSFADTEAGAGKQEAKVAASDIAGHWAGDAMNKWRSEGMLKGDEAGNMRPDASISRAEFMALVNRTMGYSKMTADLSKYKDVEEKAWYRDEVAKAISAGYISGTSAEKVEPLMPISNEQTFLILTRLSKAEGKMDLSVVKDNGDISAWAKSGVEKAIANGYVTGYDGQIMPKKETSRAQTVVLLERFRSNERVIAFPGVYELKDAGKVTVLSKGVTLKNTVIKGDLVLKSGVEKIGIENTKVSGKVLKEEGKELKATDIKNVTAAKEEIQKELKDGTYEGIGKGYGGDMRFQVVIKGGKIVDIKVLSHNETGSYLRRVEGLLKQIVEKGSIDGVDTVGGATMTSKAILNGVKDVYSQAKGETMKAGESEASKVVNSGRKNRKDQSDKPNHMSFRNITDGKYTGTAAGYRAGLKVEVIASGGNINKIEIIEHNEDSSYLERAKKVIEKIISSQSTEVETIAGATRSSNGII